MGSFAIEILLKFYYVIPASDSMDDKSVKTADGTNLQSIFNYSAGKHLL